jgi:hypothetical protein
MIVASMNADPFFTDHSSTKYFERHFKGYGSHQDKSKYTIYCAIAVPKNEYQVTSEFDVRNYILSCIQKGTPVKVYIGKCSNPYSGISNYHTYVLTCPKSSIGNSILSNEEEWFHVTSQQYLSSDDAKKAEALAHAFVNWRCHHAKTRESGFFYMPAWKNNESQTFQTLTTNEDKLGLFRIFKDTENFQLFCKANLDGKCNANHGGAIEIVKGKPYQTLLFNANWHINEGGRTPLKIRFDIG